MRVGELSCGFKSALSLVSCRGLEFILHAIKFLVYDAGETTRPRSEWGSTPTISTWRHDADQRPRPLGEHRLHIGRAADDLALAPAGLLEQNLEAPADACPIERLQLLLDQRLKLVEPAVLRRRVDLAGASAAGVPGRAEYLKA